MNSFSLSNLAGRTFREVFRFNLPEYAQIAMEATDSWATWKVPGEEWAIQLLYTDLEGKYNLRLWEIVGNQNEWAKRTSGI